MNEDTYSWFVYGLALGWLLSQAFELLRTIRRQNRVWYSVDGTKHKGY